MDRMERSLNIKAVAEATLVSEEVAQAEEAAKEEAAKAEAPAKKPAAKKKAPAKKKSS